MTSDPMHPPALVEAMARAILRSEGSDVQDKDDLAYHDKDRAQAALTAYAEHLKATGMVVVPEVPTEGMVGAAYRADVYPADTHADGCRREWAAMIAAAKGEA